MRSVAAGLRKELESCLALCRATPYVTPQAIVGAYVAETATNSPKFLGRWASDLLRPSRKEYAQTRHIRAAAL